MQNPDPPKIITVADGLTIRQEIDNMGWMDMGDYGLAVDALEKAHLEAEVFDAIDKTLGEKPIRFLLNTHTHYDHIALNNAFIKRWDTTVVNMENADIPMEGRWFEGTSRRAQMIPLPGCHTATDCLIWLPEDRTLFAGDLFGWGLIPLSGPLTDETARDLLAVYSRMIDFDASTVVPGHGPLCDTGTLRRWVRYFQDLRRQVGALLGDGVSADRIRSDITPPEDMCDWWRFCAWKHEDSLNKMIESLASGRLRAG